VDAERVNKVLEGGAHIVDRIRAGEVAMVINTTEGAEAIRDSRSLRRETLLAGIPYFTTIAAASAAVSAIERMAEGEIGVRSIQEYHASSVSSGLRPPRT
jgi:carbamoyl-phosphate synthase large subunit